MNPRGGSPPIIRLDTSIRTIPVAETWEHLKDFGHRFGVSRVTDTTRLDRVGVPVFAAIRPSAPEGSLCVASGKAVREGDARTGALCEAIEFESALFDPERDSVAEGTIESFESQFDLDVYDFCVRSSFLKRLSGQTRLDLMEVREYYSGTSFLLPATLVFLPYDEPVGTRVFGQSSNGLSGGNSELEALLHAVLELLERDALSLALAGAGQRRVTEINEPRWRWLRDQVRAAGLSIYVTRCDSVLQLPMFVCYLFDRNPESGVRVARGQGIHLDRGIALCRATTEAIQSRLTNIHGARDDIIDRFLEYRDLGTRHEYGQAGRLERCIRSYPTERFSEIPTYPLSGSFEALASGFFRRLFEAGFRYVFYADLTKHTARYRVVKAIVPGLECYSLDQQRVGKRLISYLDATCETKPSSS